MSKIKN